MVRSQRQPSMAGLWRTVHRVRPLGSGTAKDTVAYLKTLYETRCGEHIADIFSCQEIFSRNERSASGDVPDDLIFLVPRKPQARLATAKTGFRGWREKQLGRDQGTLSGGGSRACIQA